MNIFFSAKQNRKPLSEHYAFLKGIWEELNVYQPLSDDIEVQRRQWQEFQVAKFLSSLDSKYVEVKPSILASEKLPSLSNVYACLQRIDLQSFSSGMVLRILLHLHPQDRIKVILLFKAEVEVQEQEKVEVTNNAHIVIGIIIPLTIVRISLVILHELIGFLLF